MARACQICLDSRLQQINIACLEGLGTKAIAEKFGLTQRSIDSHRTGGHPSRELTRRLLDAQSGPLSELSQIFIAGKANRVRRLDELLNLAWDALGVQAEKGKDAIDPVLIKVSKDLLECAAKEVGQWVPDGGKAAEATTKLAQSIVIHAAVEARKMEAPSIDGKVLKIGEIK